MCKGVRRTPCETKHDVTFYRAMKVKSQKSYEDNYVLSSANVCAICMYSNTFVHTAFAVVSCAVPVLSAFYSPVVSILQTRVCDIPSAHF